MKRALIFIATLASLSFLPACDPAVPKLYGAGDIAGCGAPGDTATGNRMEELLSDGGQAYTLGDNAYPHGTHEEFLSCYHPTWGAFKEITNPTPGNHDYETAGADGYFDYFDPRSAPDGGRDGIYHKDFGNARVFYLNSETNISAGASYLRNTGLGGKACGIAMYHKPYRSSGSHGNDPDSAPLWEAAYDIGVNLVMNGHDHNLEIFGLLDRGGNPVEPFERGMREMVVGTGGTPLRSMGTTKPGSQLRNSETFGVMELDLTGSNSIHYQFHPVSGGTILPNGDIAC